MEKNPNGLGQKFSVTRLDGEDAPGGKHYGDEYFVLNLTTDERAIPAISAYIQACEADNPTLAADLRAKVAAKVARENEMVSMPDSTLPCGLHVPGFNVSKYLASKSALGTPVSVAKNRPWVNISYIESGKVLEDAGLCRLKESQALALIWDISQQPVNWTGGAVGVGIIFPGLHKGNVSGVQDGLYESDDPEERRWHQLSTGEKIYDLAGNAFTQIFDDIQGGADGLTGEIKADSPSLTTLPYPSQKNGVGWRPEGGANWAGYVLLRGGCWSSGSRAGVFRLGYVDPSRRYDYVGFRFTTNKGL